MARVIKATFRRSSASSRLVRPLSSFSLPIAQFFSGDQCARSRAPCRSDRFLSRVVADVVTTTLLQRPRYNAVVGDFPAMELERATRGTNRGSPRGIPRKTRSHQDSRMLALCCTDPTYWPLQLPCTINRDPARGARIPKERGKKGREEGREEGSNDERGDAASHVVAHRPIFPSSFSFSFCSTCRFRGRSLSFFLFLSPSFPFVSISGSGKGRRSLKREIA